jgi:hypothetical protein
MKKKLIQTNRRDPETELNKKENQGNNFENEIIIREINSGMNQNN